MSNSFWDDLSRDLEDPEFRREYIVESIRIATIDSLMSTLEDAREAEGLSKADIARALHTEPATIRRLFSSEAANPTIGTLAEVAAVVGYRITVEPLSGEERECLTAPLRAKWLMPTQRLAAGLHRIRAKAKRAHRGGTAEGKVEVSDHVPSH